MEFDLSPKVIAVLFIVLGIAVVFMLMGGSLEQLFSASVQETVTIQIKQSDTCIVEASDAIPRTIDNCPYQQGQNITISYKEGLPSIESHQDI